MSAKELPPNDCALSHTARRPKSLRFNLAKVDELISQQSIYAESR
jgi:hypothetical protein